MALLISFIFRRQNNNMKIYVELISRFSDNAMRQWNFCVAFSNGVDDENSFSRVFREHIKDHGKVKGMRSLQNKRFVLGDEVTLRFLLSWLGVLGRSGGFWKSLHWVIFRVYIELYRFFRRTGIFKGVYIEFRFLLKYNVV